MTDDHLNLITAKSTVLHRAASNVILAASHIQDWMAEQHPSIAQNQPVGKIMDELDLAQACEQDDHAIV